MGHTYNAIATHTLDIGHRIGFSQARLVYASRNIQTRKIVEGALICLNQTFDGNKASTNEDKYTNFTLCNSLGINNFCNIAATLSPAALPLFSQVDVLALRDTHSTGTYADPPGTPPPPDPPDDIQQGRALRRSRRLQERNNPS